MTDSNILTSFAYNGRDFGLVEEDTIVQLAGNKIVLWNLTTNEKDYIQCPRQNGYSAVTTSLNKNMIAAAECGLEPACHIYQMPNKRVIADFKMQTTLKCLQMAFSRDGKYLLMVGGLPDFNISIYDLENKKLLTLSDDDIRLKCCNELKQGRSTQAGSQGGTQSSKDEILVSFNPKTKNEFIIMSASKVYFYSILPAFKFIEGQEGAGAYEQQSEGGEHNFVDAFRFKVEEFSAEDIPTSESDNQSGVVRFRHAAWDSYGRVLLCTNQRKVFHITSKAPRIGATLDLANEPVSTIMTPQHLIVADEHGQMQWFKVEPPYEDANAKEEDQFLVLKQQVDKQYDFGGQLPEEARSPSHFMHYSRSHAKMVIGTQRGILCSLPIAAEKINYDEEEQEYAAEHKTVTLVDPLTFIGRFHTAPVSGLVSLGKSSQVATISLDSTFALWETTTQTQLCCLSTHGRPTALATDITGDIVFIGSAVGTIRIYDVSDRSTPRLLQQLKFFEDKQCLSSITCSQDGKYVLISSQQCDTIFVLSQKASDEFTIFGIIQAHGFVLSTVVVKKDGEENRSYALAVLSNNLLESYLLPDKVLENRLEPIPAEDLKSHVRKLDDGSEMVIGCEDMRQYSRTHQFIICGTDRYLKVYEHFPTDDFKNVDWKKPAIKSNTELEGHSLGTSCYKFNLQQKILVTGGLDGMIEVRQYDNQHHLNTDPILALCAHSVNSGGIRCLDINSDGSLIYSASGDGSIMIHTLTGEQMSQTPVPREITLPKESQALRELPEVDLISDIKNLDSVHDYMMKEFHKKNEAKKIAFRNQILTELDNIRKNLNDIKQANERAPEIEKLEIDEFVVDVSKKDELWESGVNVCKDIRKKAEEKILTLQLLAERVKAKTWDTIEVQSTACKSLNSEKMIFNYAIRRRNPNERRRLHHLIQQRKIELRQKLERMEKKMGELVDEVEFSGLAEIYFMNRISGKPSFMDDDSIAEAARIFEEERLRKIKEKNDALNNLNMNQQEGNNNKMKPILTLTKGKLGTKTRKRDPDEEARLAALQNKSGQRDIKGMEEIHWRVIQTRRSIDDLKLAIESPNIYDLLYEPFELHNDRRKRIQIELIKEVVFELKRDFNKEFAQLQKLKGDQIFAISEKNEQIKELQQNLQVPEDLETFPQDLLERPEHIFEIDEATEIKCERHLTKEQRAVEEEKERKRLEKEALLAGDNLGQRGLKSMLGGNELIFRKDKSKLEDELVREEWMNKPETEMTEDEKSRLREFEQRVADLQEKQRKQWDVNLKRVKAEIVEIKLKFEEALLALYKKRIFYEARICEQELLVIRHTIFLHDVVETKNNVIKFSDQFGDSHQALSKQTEFLGICRDMKNEFESKMKNDTTIQSQEQRIRNICKTEDLNEKYILQFVRNGKQQCRVQINQDQEAKMKEDIVSLDPCFEIDTAEVDSVIKTKQKEEQYDFERDRNLFGEVLQEQFEKMVDERMIRMRANQIMENNNKRLGQLSAFISHLENKKMTLLDENNTLQLKAQKAEDRNEKLKFNFEVIVYMKQGQVEVPQLPVATDYKDAILVNRSEIEIQNREIIEKGRKKVSNMRQIYNNNKELKHVKYEVKRLTLQILDCQERALDVQLYRVTKQTQEIIQGKYQKKDEEDKKRLESQIKQLESNSNSRLQSYEITKKKLMQEIKEKQRENSEMENKARDLRMEVDQRQQIIQLKSETNNDSKSAQRKKIMAIANQRKMVDVIKQQQEEIMFLKDELDRLRARTFPSFAHIQNKSDFPDER